jgi:NAD(P)-dependent dehydrogenase (short-subunit alcohol dehydrogenase family)
MSEHQGKVAWVTGSARGIGAAIADELAAQEATVVRSDRTSSEGVEACDMTDVDSIRGLSRAILERFGRLDILVNNAGIQIRRDAAAYSPEEFHTIFRTNVRGVFFASQAAARFMVDNKTKGAIVNICSVNADRAQPEGVVYAGSKGAVRTMTKALALALGPYGIRVNSVAPGPILTDFNRERLSDTILLQTIVGRSALGRIGKPTDIAGAVAFLASDKASYVTGATIPVHGGWSIRG